jgi:membrane protein implicated in regulation of membrane protease activity
VEPLSTISKLYVISTFVGSIFMVISVLMGRLPRGHGAIHHGGGHTGHSGHAPKIGHTASHSGGHSGAHSGSANHAGSHSASVNSGHAGHSGSDAGVSHSAQNADAIQHLQSVRAHQIALQNQSTPGARNDLGQSISLKLQSRTGHLHVGLKEHGVIEIILSVLNPLSIATFLAFFGITGMVAGIALHINPWITFVAAVTCGWLAVQAVIQIIGWLFTNMHVSTESRVADLIGQIAEVNIPITTGRTGEITYIVGSKRLTAPAKSLVPELEIPRKTRVIICDIQNHVMFVDVWRDDFTAQSTEVDKQT